MALRDQPYLPLYIQDFMTDEKLIECSASTTGVYIRIMCIMHKSEQYGTILLKQKHKQTDKQILNFASQLAKSLPYDLFEIEKSITELLDEKVIEIDGDLMIQKRMVKDNDISVKRSNSGSLGGKKTQNKTKTTINKFAKAKIEANTEYETVIENGNENKIEVGKPKKTKVEKFKFGEFENVLLTEEEHEKAKAKFKEDLQPMIEKLSSYLQSSGKTYKSHYATFSSWVNKAVLEEKQKNGHNAQKQTGVKVLQSQEIPKNYGW